MTAMGEQLPGGRMNTTHATFRYIFIYIFIFDIYVVFVCKVVSDFNFLHIYDPESLFVCDARS